MKVSRFRVKRFRIQFEHQGSKVQYQGSKVPDKGYNTFKVPEVLKKVFVSMFRTFDTWGSVF